MSSTQVPLPDSSEEEREFDLEHVLALIESDQKEPLKTYTEGLPPNERARLFYRLDEHQRGIIIDVLDPEFAADMLEGFGEAQAIEIIEQLEPQVAAGILDHVSSDDQADLLSECEAQKAEAILNAMDPVEAVDARQLMAYEWDTAGGMMVTEYLAYPETTTVAEVAADMQAQRDAYAEYDIQYVYITDEQKSLLGVMRLRDLVLAQRDEPVSKLMLRSPVSVRADEELHQLFQFFHEHNYLGLPVVDEQNRLLGVLQRSAVEEAMSEEATENFLKVSGLRGNEELRSMPLFLRSRRRLSWLSTNILLNIMAASVIAANQATLESVIALAVFLPIISDMSGASGNQAIGVSIRELTLGLIKPREFLRVFWKEIQVGFINGTALGLLVAGAGWLWQSNAWFGLVVGTALLLNTVVAVLVGGLVPLLLKKLKADPAMASAPILTTITDMCGFFFVLFFASQVIEKLV